MIRAMLVEDNPLDLASLQEILTKIQPDITFVTYSNGIKAIEHLEQHRPVDIFFIDRQMPGMNGFEFAEKVRNMEQHTMTPIVFVTGYHMNQLEAFQEYHCYSYIVKPLIEKDVRKSLEDMLTSMNKKILKKVVPLMQENGTSYILLEDMLGLERKGRDCCVYTVHGTYLVKRQSLEQMLEEMNHPYCIRCHKSFALNVSNVKRILPVRRNIWTPDFTESEIFKCEISKTYYKEVMESYERCCLERE